MSQRELRVLDTAEVRALGGSGDADPLRLEGYAAVFNRNAKLPKFEERIRPGAFTRSIDGGADVVFLLNHNSDFPLARTTNGSLQLKQDSRGLHFIATLANTQTARDTHELVRSGTITGCSFGFMVDKGQEWSEGRAEDGSYFVLRTLTDFERLTDCSCVTYPCYDGTQVSARAEEPPAELRSAVDAKNLAMIVPPAIEKRPYSNVSEVPDSVPKSKRKQWMEVWNSVYDKSVKGGKSAKDAESSAFAQANGVVKESKSMPSDKFEFRAVTGIDGFDIKPQDCPASWTSEMQQAYCDGYNAAYAKAKESGVHAPNALMAIAISGGMMGIHEMMTLPAKSGTEQPANSTLADTDRDNDSDEAIANDRSKKMVAEHRDDSIEDFLCDMREAVASKFPYTSPGAAAPTGGSDYWVCETFDTYVIVSKGGPGDSDYFAIPYTIGDDGETITLGDAVPVEKTWIPSDRAAKRIAEMRDMNEDDDDEGDDDEDLLDEEFDTAYIGRNHDDTFHEGHMDDGNCDDPDCSSQNRFAPTGSMYRNAPSAGVEYNVAGSESFKRFDELPAELRSGMTRTKRVAGKDLSASSFAFVGDPNKTETWKFPIQDASHVRNALARWGQHKGIPSDKEAGVYAKIKAAAKKFGIEVSEPDAKAAARAETQAEKELRLRLAEHMAHVGPDFAVTL